MIVNPVNGIEVDTRPRVSGCTRDSHSRFHCTNCSVFVPESLKQITPLGIVISQICSGYLVPFNGSK